VPAVAVDTEDAVGDGGGAGGSSTLPASAEAGAAAEAAEALEAAAEVGGCCGALDGAASVLGLAGGRLRTSTGRGRRTSASCRLLLTK
jgi:hypothetical protein